MLWQMKTMQFEPKWCRYNAVYRFFSAVHSKSIDCEDPETTFTPYAQPMRKSLLLFSLLILAIVLWKLTEASEDKQWNDATVEELVSDYGDDKIAKN